MDNSPISGSSIETGDANMSIAKGCIFRGVNEMHNDIDTLPDPPPWREFTPKARVQRGQTYQASDREKEMINAALYLRRPLLVTGKPGIGKSSLAYAVAHELGLGEVLVWPITTRSTLQQGLYNYDAIGRLQEASRQRVAQGDNALSGSKLLAVDEDIGRYIRLGPMGTAMLGLMTEDEVSVAVTNSAETSQRKCRPRVLLIDEIDKSDIDLPNDLLNIFEEGEFEIQELARLPEDDRFRYVEVATHKGRGKVRIERGHVRCEAFPLVIMTSNGEREFPPAFLRRCLRLRVEPPNADTLRKIVEERLSPNSIYAEAVEALIKTFVDRRDAKKAELATDQLLNAVYMVMQDLEPSARETLTKALLQPLSESPLGLDTSETA